jgi:hypothetical protein
LWVIFALLDLDTLTQLNPDPIGIRIRNPGCRYGTCLAGWLAGAVPGTAAAAAAGAGAGGAGGQQERPGLGTQPRQEYNLVNKGIFL